MRGVVAWGGLALVGCSNELTLTTARMDPATAVIDGHLYVFGGYDGVSAVSSIERAPINGDELGAFERIDSHFVAARAPEAIAVVGEYVYAVGGLGQPGWPVERAWIQADGSLGAFHEMLDVAYATPRALPSVAFAGSDIFLVGGGDRTNALLDSVEHSTITSDGSVTPFQPIDTAHLLTPRISHESIVVGQFLYTFGGRSGDTAFLDSVERARIASGTLDAFEPAGSLVRARLGHDVVIAGSSVFVLGGVNGPLAFVPDIERARFSEDGTLGAFAIASGARLLRPRFGFSSIQIGSYLYVLGGADGRLQPLDTIERSPIASDGSLGEFEAY